MSDLSRKVSRLNRLLEDVQYTKNESIFAKYTDERLRYLMVTFAKGNGLIPEDYTDPEFERAVKIIRSLPKSKSATSYNTKEFESKEATKCRLRLLEPSEDDLREFIPNFDKIKLKSPEGTLREKGLI